MKTELERLKVLSALKLGYGKLTPNNTTEAEFKNIEDAIWIIENCNMFYSKQKIAEIMHNELLAMQFTKCDDGKYRRCMIHDFINVFIDDYGYLFVNAELEHNNQEIQITMFNNDEILKFKQWLLLTDGTNE